MLTPKTAPANPQRPFPAPGLDTIGQRDLQDACALLEAALRQDPDHGASPKALADVCAALGRCEAAEQHYRAAMVLEPALAPAWNNLGLLLKATGRPEQAMAAVTRAAEADALLVAAGQAPWQYPGLTDTPNLPGSNEAVSGCDAPGEAAPSIAGCVEDDQVARKFRRSFYRACTW